MSPHRKNSEIILKIKKNQFEKVDVLDFLEKMKEFSKKCSVGAKSSREGTPRYLLEWDIWNNFENRKNECPQSLICLHSALGTII